MGWVVNCTPEMVRRFGFDMNPRHTVTPGPCSVLTQISDSPDSPATLPEWQLHLIGCSLSFLLGFFTITLSYTSWSNTQNPSPTSSRVPSFTIKAGKLAIIFPRLHCSCSSRGNSDSISYMSADEMGKVEALFLLQVLGCWILLQQVPISAHCIPGCGKPVASAVAARGDS